MASLHGEAHVADAKQPNVFSIAASSSGIATPAGPSHQEEEEYDAETVEKVYRKLDLRIFPGDYIIQLIK